MKQNCTLKRMLSALPLFLLLGIFVASCSKDDNEASNPEYTDQNIGNTIPEEAHVWEYYSINKDGENVTVTEAPDNDSNIYKIVYIPSIVNIDGKDYSVTSIGKSAFDGCSSLASISIPEGVTSIEDYAFRGCRSLTSISIPESVTSIGGYVFYECRSLTSIFIPKSVTYIGGWTFYACSSLTSISVAAENPIYDSREGCNAIIETASNMLCWGCQNTIIPNGVTSIRSNAFWNCASLKSISIPESVTSIGNSAFKFCVSLSSISIPKGVTSIGSNAFQGCSALMSLSVSESVTSIGDDAFAECFSLTSISVAAGNPIFDSREECNAIIETSSNTLTLGCQSTIIPESVTSIGIFAFYGCSSLTSISIPESVTSIGVEAFMKCSSLTSISISKGVTYIGGYTFDSCSSLTSVTCLAEELPELGANVFTRIPQSEATLYVPASVLEKYKAADQWKDFGKILPIE